MTKIKVEPTIDFLDNLLLHIKETSKISPTKKNVIDVLSLEKHEKELMYRAMRKLREDGFVFTKLRFYNEKNKTTMFYISFSGLLFLKSGGYKKQLRRKANQDRLQALAVWITAIGTGLAGIYALVQFGQWLISKC